MLRVHGFYGHVRANDLRSLVTFAGFMVAIQIVAAPVLFVPLVFLDPRHSPIYVTAYAGRYALPILVAGAGFFAIGFFRHVATVRATVAFAEVDRRTNPRLVNMVETAAIAAGLPAPKVGLIETPACNAFACGIRASSAVVVVTRGLLETLDDDELAAVVAHEIAHIRNGDIRLMAAANVLMDMLLWLQRRNLLRVSNWRRALLAVVFPAYMVLASAAGFVTRFGLMIGRVSRLLISSSREFVADADAVRLTQKPEALISALRRIEGRSAIPGLSPQADAMMIDGAAEGHYATHPTIAERIEVLARLSGVTAAAPPRTVPHVKPDSIVAAGSELFAAITRPERAARPGQSRSVFGRVSVGPDEHPLGMTRNVKWIVGTGLGLLVALQLFAVLTTFGFQKRAKPSEAERAVVAERTKLRERVERLSTVRPVEARCFATSYYRVGDRGSRRLKQPDPDLVEAYARGIGRDSSDVVIERYLGHHQRTIRAVERAEPEGLDGALLEYARTRKMVLHVVHRFFGEEGLQLLRETYESRADQAVLRTLRARLAEGLEPPPEMERLRDDMELLVAAPEDFVPCVVRAGLDRAGA